MHRKTNVLFPQNLYIYCDNLAKTENLKLFLYTSCTKNVWLHFLHSVQVLKNPEIIITNLAYELGNDLKDEHCNIDCKRTKTMISYYCQ